MGKVTALSAFTPVLTDILYGVDDPGGTPASGKMTITSLRDLLEDNFTAVTIGSDVILERDAANALALRNSTNGQTFRVYNSFTDASNYERGYMRWDTTSFEIGTEGAGTGNNARIVELQVGGTTMMEINSSGIVSKTILRPDSTAANRALGTTSQK